MAWVFPTSIFKTGTVLDWLEWNEMLGAHVDQIDGGLKEHNLVIDIGDDLLSEGKVSRNVGIRLFSKKAVYDSSAETPTLGGAEVVPLTLGWHPVANSQIDFGSPAGKILVIIAFQPVMSGITPQLSPGMHFCIEVDGVPQLSSICGSADMSNERFLTDPGQLDLSSSADHNSGASHRHTLGAYRVEGVFTVDSGPHTVRLLCRNPYLFPDAPDQRQFIGSVETIIAFLWA
jgi:hypothetical protein